MDFDATCLAGDELLDPLVGHAQETGRITARDAGLGEAKRSGALASQVDLVGLQCLVTQA